MKLCWKTWGWCIKGTQVMAGSTRTCPHRGQARRVGRQQLPWPLAELLLSGGENPGPFGPKTFQYTRTKEVKLQDLLLTDPRLGEGPRMGDTEEGQAFVPGHQ